MQEGEETMPSLFVKHLTDSFKTIHKARDSNNIHHRSLYRLFRGVIFLGTPHKRSGAADFGSLCAKVLKRLNSGVNRRLIDDFKRSSVLLVDISETFKNCQADLFITSFYETQTLHGKFVSSSPLFHH
jgi:hypothetical protein